MARAEPSGQDERAAAAPELADLTLRAEALVKRFPGCFWFWHPEARIRTRDDVRLVVRHLRDYGDREAWLAARDLNQSTFRRARVRAADGEVLVVDWAADSAFRFFPIERDPALGWRLHLFDAATNKALTLAAICWAACGKDPGFTPLSLLKMMRRFARVDPQELDKIRARALEATTLKASWIAMSDEAEARMTKLADERPEVPIGVAFVDASGAPGWIEDDPAPRLHAPSVGGCWPTVYGTEGA